MISAERAREEAKRNKKNNINEALYIIEKIIMSYVEVGETSCYLTEQSFYRGDGTRIDIDDNEIINLLREYGYSASIVLTGPNESSIVISWEK